MSEMRQFRAPTVWWFAGPILICGAISIVSAARSDDSVIVKLAIGIPLVVVLGWFALAVILGKVRADEAGLSIRHGVAPPRRVEWKDVAGFAFGRWEAWTVVYVELHDGEKIPMRALTSPFGRTDKGRAARALAELERLRVRAESKRAALEDGATSASS